MHYRQRRSAPQPGLQGLRMTKAESRSRLVAILAALLVVTLWSSSWMPIKLVLQEIPPLTFAGLRY